MVEEAAEMTGASSWVVVACVLQQQINKLVRGSVQSARSVVSNVAKVLVLESYWPDLANEIVQTRLGGFEPSPKEKTAGQALLGSCARSYLPAKCKNRASGVAIAGEARHGLLILFRRVGCG